MKKSIKTIKTTTETTKLIARYNNIDELLKNATRSTQNALKMCATGDNFVDRLIKQMQSDAKALNEIYKVDEEQNVLSMSDYINQFDIETAEQLEELTERKKSITKALNRVSTPNEDRITLGKELENINYQIADIKGDIKDIEKLTESTLSERQDCVQAWLLSYLYEEPTQKIINSTINIMLTSKTPLDLLEDLETVYHLASVRTAKNAVCRYVYSLGGINALDSTQTKTTEAAAGAVTAWLNSGKILDIKYPTAKQGTTIMLTIEDNKHVFKVTHSTFKQCNSITVTDEDGNETVIHSNNVAVFNQEDKEQIIKLMQCPDLVERERMFIRKFMTREAIAQGQKARIKYFNANLKSLQDKKTNKAKFIKGLGKAEFNGRKQGALEQMYNSYPTLKKSKNADRFFERLSDKLKKYDWEKLPKTAKTYDQILNDDFQYMMESPRAIREPKTEHVDGLAWLTGKRVKTDAVKWLTYEQAKRKHIKESIKQWTKYNTPEPTEEQALLSEILYIKKHGKESKDWSIDRKSTKSNTLVTPVYNANVYEYAPSEPTTDSDNGKYKGKTHAVKSKAWELQQLALKAMKEEEDQRIKEYKENHNK